MFIDQKMAQSVSETIERISNLTFLHDAISETITSG